jgi:uracil-DNA glycosylase family 4
MTGLIERKRVKDSVRECRRCALGDQHGGPVPFDSPIGEVDIVVVGEAPGGQEDAVGTPFVGPSGQLARRWLAGAGINEVDVAWMNVVSCYPDRTPTTKEVAACSTNLQAQWEFLDPKYVLVLGGVALSALCPIATRISEAAGYFWRPNVGSLKTSVWAMATYHPAAILRNASLEDQVLTDLEYFAMVAKEEVDPAPNQFCMKCKKADVWEYHACGLGFCEKCWGLSVK